MNQAYLNAFTLLDACSIISYLVVKQQLSVYPLTLYEREYKASFYQEDSNSLVQVEVLRGSSRTAVLTGIGKGVTLELGIDHGKISPLIIE